jgi:hypothetical protein
MIDLLKKRQEARGKAYDEFQAANTEKEQYKKQLEEYVFLKNIIILSMRNLKT